MEIIRWPRRRPRPRLNPGLTRISWADAVETPGFPNDRHPPPATAERRARGDRGCPRRIERGAAELGGARIRRPRAPAADAPGPAPARAGRRVAAEAEAERPAARPAARRRAA